MALPGVYGKFVRISLRHQHREPLNSPLLRWFFSLSLNFLAHGNILGSVKAEFSIWKFLDRWMYQSWSCMTNISSHMEGNLINKHVMNNFYPGMLLFLAMILEGLSNHFLDGKHQ